MDTAKGGGFSVPARFPVAVGALVVLGKSGGVNPSVALSSQCHANATFLRRVMAPILRAGIVAAREGRDGGYYLARPMEQVTLADIYLAVSPPHDADECPDSPAEVALDHGLGLALKEILLETEEQVIATLRRHTLADLVRRAIALDRTLCPPQPQT